MFTIKTCLNTNKYTVVKLNLNNIIIKQKNNISKIKLSKTI